MTEQTKKPKEQLEKAYVSHEQFTLEERELHKKYEKKIRRCLYTTIGLMGISFATVLSSNLVPKPEPTPIIEKYKQINSTLQVLYFEQNKIKKDLDLPYITPEIRKELSGFLDDKEIKIKGLDNAIRLAQRDSTKVCNTKEFRDYNNKFQKSKKINDIFDYITLGFMGLTFLSISPVLYYQEKQKKIHYRKISKRSAGSCIK